MPLQASGQISISQIRTELLRRGTNSYSLRTQSAAAGKSTPDAMSEFYSFNGCNPNGTFYQQQCYGVDLYNFYYDGTCNADGTSFGLYQSPAQYNSPTCGYVAPAYNTILQERICLNYLCPNEDVLCAQYASYPLGSATQRADGVGGVFYVLQYGSDYYCE